MLQPMQTGERSHCGTSPKEIRDDGSNPGESVESGTSYCDFTGELHNRKHT